MSIGKHLWPGRWNAALSAEQPLQVVGVINAYCARLAADAGFRAIYLSGAGVANASFGLPDLGMTSLGDVCEDVRRVTSVTDLPLLVDADTGFGGPLMVSRTIRELARAGAAGAHLEDQVQSKRCGHRAGKVLVPISEMVERIKAAVDGRPDAGFAIMARTDAYGLEPLDAAIARAKAYVDAGADMVFAEAVSRLEDYRRFTDALGVPVMANLTEFGKTPLFTLDQLQSVGVRMALYPLSAFRAMNAAALKVYRTLRERGTQADLLDQMQTRDDLYRVLGYHEFERKLDKLLQEEQNHG